MSCDDVVDVAVVAVVAVASFVLVDCCWSLNEWKKGAEEDDDGTLRGVDDGKVSTNQRLQAKLEACKPRNCNLLFEAEARVAVEVAVVALAGDDDDDVEGEKGEEMKPQPRPLPALYPKLLPPVTAVAVAELLAVAEAEW